MSKIEKLRESVPFLRNFSEKDMATFLTFIKPVSKPAGYLLYSKGDTPDNFHVIISGEIEIYLDISSSTETRKKVITVLKGGDLVGEMGFAMKGERTFGNRTAHARTTTDVILFEISTNTLDQRPELNTIIFQNLSRVLAMKLVETNKLITRVR
jgi:CRP-like cAMP-binding protein